MTRHVRCWVLLLFAALSLLLLLLLLLSAAAADDGFEFKSKAIVSADHPNSRPAARSLMSSQEAEEDHHHPLELLALLDGTIYLVDTPSGRLVSSFSSGPPIYSSYQAPFKHNISVQADTDFFLDYGDNWQLYAYLSHSSKVAMNIEDFVKITPFISEDGSRTLGSKTTAIFVLDAETGRLVESHKLPNTSGSDSPSTPRNNKEEDSAHDDDDDLCNKDPLVSAHTSVFQTIEVMRTDYELETRLPNGAVSWSMKAAVIDAFSICRDAVISTADENDSSFEIPLSCQSRRIQVRKEDKPKPSLYDAMSQPDSSVLLPLQPKTGEYSNNHDGQMMPHGSGASATHPMQHEVDNVLESDQETSNLSIKLFWIALTIVLLVIVLCVAYLHHASVATGKVDLEQSRSNRSKSLPPKKRKPQKSGIYEALDGHMLLGNEDQLASHEGSILDINKHVDHGASGNIIGKMLISTVEIAKGSNGTIVLEGIYEGRPVAVKRLVRAHHDVAFKEIQNLIASDTHPNIVRWYGVEYDKDFVYLSLERCTCSLGDLIQGYSNSYLNLSFLNDQPAKEGTACKLGRKSASASAEDFSLWKANGQPSSQLLTVMRDMVSGLVHLHELGIIHRDLKPQNVLIIKERLLRAKLSDMGISKRLLGDNSSLGHHATDCGSSGWQAPEQLLHGRQTRGIDLFSLGCVLFYCITGGRHPFGEHIERDINIVRNQMNLFLLEHYPEALDLIHRLLSPNPKLRPKALEVLQHPIFWSSETRLSFLRDTSDRVELEDRKSASDILKALECVGSIALGGKWNEKMEPIFINNIGHYRRYKFDSVRDLLRVLRNKLNHYRELPGELQELLGPIPEGYDNYFAIRFPKLLIEVYKMVYHFCREEECFQKYFKSNVI